jgi:hypothetical protein
MRVGCWCPALNINAGYQSQAFATPTRLGTALQVGTVIGVPQSPCVLVVDAGGFTTVLAASFATPCSGQA